MASGRFAQEYRKNAVNGAYPLKIVLMLYEGALRFMEAGKHAMAHRDVPKQNEALQRAQKIVMELMSCLDMKDGGEIATNLMALYTYVLNELIDANVADKPDGIDRSIRVMCDLRESWVQVEGTFRRGEAHAA